MQSHWRLRDLRKTLVIVLVASLVSLPLTPSQARVEAPTPQQLSVPFYELQALDIESPPEIKTFSIQEIAAQINVEEPEMDWDQWCQALIWSTVRFVAGVPREGMVTYPSASAARYSSEIVSHDYLAAPPGAIHYWQYPADGHVAMSLGNGLVFMTGTQEALGPDGFLLGNNFGVTSVPSYSNQSGNPYLGWSYSNGSNVSLVGLVQEFSL